MTTVERSIDVEAPVRTVYDQWTQFEEFPRFMEGVEQVTQIDETQVHWVAKIGGQRREWDATITEQKPDDRVAWSSREGSRNAGVVTFHRLDDTHTRVMLQLRFDPKGALEKLGAALGIVAKRAAGDLKRFRDFIEARGHETGAWRGTIDAPPQDGGR